MVLIVLRKKAYMYMYSQKWKLHINRFCWWVYAVKIYLCTLEFAHFFLTEMPVDIITSIIH